MAKGQQTSGADAKRGATSLWTKGGGRYSPLILIAAALALLSSIYVVLQLPLGIPGEWTTYYHRQFASPGRLFAFAVILGLFVLAALLTERYHGRASRAMRAVCLAALTCLYGVVLFRAATTGPVGTPEFIAPASQHGASGLFQNESNRIGPGLPFESPGEYLSKFPATLRAYAKDYEDTVRVNNNPPGITLIFYAARRLAERYPSLAEFASGPVFGRGYVPVGPKQAQTIIGIWILHLGAMLAFVPAYLVASNLAGRPAFAACALAMLAGSLLLFVPGKDTFQVGLFLWMYWFFLKGSDGNAVVWGIATGLATAAALFFTLAALLILALLAGYEAVRFIARDECNWWRRLVFWISVLGGVVAGFLLLRLAGYNSPASLWECYRNHAGFYASFQRTYWKWVLFNPVEFTLFTGGPLVAVIIWYGLRPASLKSSQGPRRRAAAYICVTLLLMAALNIAGKNLSEVGRLWVFFMPLLSIPACVLLRGEAGADAVGASERRAGDFVTVALMQIACLVIMRVYMDIWRVEALFESMGPPGGG